MKAIEPGVGFVGGASLTSNILTRQLQRTSTRSQANYILKHGAHGEGVAFIEYARGGQHKASFRLAIDACGSVQWALKYPPVRAPHLDNGVRLDCEPPVCKYRIGFRHLEG